MSNAGYGSAQLRRATAVAAACRQIDQTGLGGALARLRAGSLQLTWYGLRLPSITVELSPSAAGRMIAEHLAIRVEGRWRFRRAQGVLLLPDDFSAYLRGRHRQAVRTNVNHARAANLRVSSYNIADWGPGPGDTRATHIAPGPVSRWMVLDPRGTLVADAIVSVDDGVALLHGLVSTVSYARWMLHTAIVERLCGRCAVLLTNTDDVYSVSAGTQHFQRLLGYEVVRLRVTGPAHADPSATRWAGRARWLRGAALRLGLR